MGNISRSKKWSYMFLSTIIAIFLEGVGRADIVLFNESGFRWRIADGVVEEECDDRRRTLRDSTGNDAVIEANGRILEVWEEETGPRGDVYVAGGIDILDLNCGVQDRLRFENRALRGIALDASGRVWVFDYENDLLLRVDLERREIAAEISVGGLGLISLAAIDQEGLYYFHDGVPDGDGVRVLGVRVVAPTGDLIRDITVNDSNVTRAEIGPKGNLWVSAFYRGGGARLIELQLDGTPIGEFSLASGAWTFGPNGTIWLLAFPESPTALKITEVTTQGEPIRDFTIPDAAFGGAIPLINYFLVSRNACPGDCDRDGRVTASELVAGVNIALGRKPLGDCSALDQDRSSLITIDELLLGVRSALAGCQIP